MVLEIKLTADDLFHYNYYTVWSAPEKRAYRRQYYLKTIAYAFAGVMLLSIIKPPKNLVAFASIGAIVAIAWGLLIGYFGIIYTYRKRLRSFSENQANSNFFTKTALYLTDAGITSIDKDAEAKYNWTAIIKKAETKDYIYLYLSAVHALIIPKKILSDEAQKNDLEVLLNKNLRLSVGLKELQPA